MEGFEDNLKFAEVVLHRTQKRLYHVLASNPTVIYLLEIRNDAFVPAWMSDNVVLMTGYETQEAIEPAWWRNRLHSEDREKTLARFASLPPGGHQVIEYRFRHKNGTYLWIRDELRVLYNPSSKPVEAVGVWSNVTEHKRVEEALQIYRAHQNKVALVLTDLVMPKIGGQELYEMLRQVNPTVRVLPMSGYGLQETVADMRAKGAKGFVQKPFDLNDLSDAVRQALDR